jgi:hypothetical protein
VVRGLEKFKEYFHEYEDQYVIIGGTACDILMENVGVSFRATNDFDVVIIAENLTGKFIERLKLFLRDGGYENLEKSTRQEQFYRFSEPKDKDFPKMVELFSRVPGNIRTDFDGQFSRLLHAGTVESLSAILLNDVYYDLLLSGCSIIEGVSVIHIEVLILFKIKAWLDLTKRRLNGEAVQMNDIKKHKNDVFRLLAIVSPSTRKIVNEEIYADISQFIFNIDEEPPFIQDLKIPSDYDTLRQLLVDIYEVG